MKTTGVIVNHDVPGGGGGGGWGGVGGRRGRHTNTYMLHLNQ